MNSEQKSALTYPDGPPNPRGWGKRLARLVREPHRIPIVALNRLARISGSCIPWTVKLTTGGTMNILLPETVSIGVANDGDFEPDVTLMMRRALRDERDPVFYDVGAHFGLRSIQAHALREGRVTIVASEPHPQTMLQLRCNTDRLSFRPGYGIVCESLAVGAEAGYVDMTDLPCRYSGSNTLYSPRLSECVLQQTAPSKHITVERTTLDIYM